MFSDYRDNNYEIIIDWIRHAESCSNFDQNNVDDKYIENYNNPDNYGYDRKESYTPKYVKLHPKKSSIYNPKLESTTGFFSGLISATSDTISQFRAASIYQPNLSFIGMQQAILLGKNYIDPLLDKNFMYDFILCSASIRSIMTALVAFRKYSHFKIYVVPFISEATNIAQYTNVIGGEDYQNNPVPTDILKRMVAFIKDWLEKDWLKYYDDIEVMEYLVDLKTELLNSKDSNVQNIIGLIDVILTCKPNILKKEKKINDLDYEKYYSECTNHKNTIEVILQKLKSNNNFMMNDKINLIVDRLDNIMVSTLRGPEVDFSILEKIEKNYKKPIPKDYVERFKLFNEVIIPELYDLVDVNNFKTDAYKINKKRLKICCVSHGHIMKEYFGKRYGIMEKTISIDEMIKEKSLDQLLGESGKINDNLNKKILKMEKLKNTEVLREIIDRKNLDDIYNFQFDPKKDKIPKIMYNLPRIRTLFKNFEDLNMDICRTGSIKGMLNYPLWDISKERNMIPLSQKSNSNLSPTKDYVNPDIANYLPDKKTLGYHVQKGYLSNKEQINNAKPEDIKYYQKYGNIIKGGYMYKYLKYKSKIENI